MEDADGRRILYPRVGKNNGSTDDLPVRLDKDGIPQYDESQLIRQEDQKGNETGVFRAYSTIRELVVDGQVKRVPVGYIETYKPLGAGVYVLVEIQARRDTGRAVRWPLKYMRTTYHFTGKEETRTEPRMGGKRKQL